MAESKPDGYLFISVAEDLNFGLLRTNPASTQGGPPVRNFNHLAMLSPHHGSETTKKLKFLFKTREKGTLSLPQIRKEKKRKIRKVIYKKLCEINI